MNRGWTTLKERIQYLLVVRCLTITLLLSSAIGFNINNVSRLDHPTYLGLTALIIATYLFSAVFAFWLKGTRRLRFAAHLGLGFDALIATTLLLLTGLQDSPFGILLVIVALYGGLLMGRRGGIIAASYASLGEILIVVLHHQKISIPLLGVSASPAPISLFSVFTLLFAVYISGILLGVLNERMERAEQDLIASRDDMRALQNLNEHILGSLQSGVLSVGLGGLIAYANSAALKLTQLSEHQVKGATLEFLGLAPPEQNGDTLDPDQPSGLLSRWECSFLRADGEIRILGLSRTDLLNATGELLGEIISFQDLTELRSVQRALNERARVATLGRFAARMAHEIRNPLASISGAAEMIEETLDGDDAMLMGIIMSEIDRLNQLVKETLEYARPQSSPRAVVDLVQLLQEISHLFQHDQLTEEIDLELSLPDEAIAQVDPESFRQIIWNLWRNAAEAIDSTGTITTKLNQEAQQWRLLIQDSGPGVPDKDVEFLFDPFFTTKREGTGLGLATVRQLLIEQRAQISFISSEEGAIFEIKLPVFSKTSPQTVTKPQANPSAKMKGSAPS